MPPWMHIKDAESIGEWKNSLTEIYSFYALFIKFALAEIS